MWDMNSWPWDQDLNWDPKSSGCLTDWATQATWVAVFIIPLYLIVFILPLYLIVFGASGLQIISPKNFWSHCFIIFWLLVFLFKSSAIVITDLLYLRFFSLSLEALGSSFYPWYSEMSWQWSFVWFFSNPSPQFIVQFSRRSLSS